MPSKQFWYGIELWARPSQLASVPELLNASLNGNKFPDLDFKICLEKCPRKVMAPKEAKGGRLHMNVKYLGMDVKQAHRFWLGIDILVDLLYAEYFFNVLHFIILKNPQIK